MTNATDAGPASETWHKAKLHLAEAESLDPLKTPSAAIHSAYYAMHHGARAALIRTDGDTAPVKHRAVVNRFGQIAKRSSEDRLRKAGRLLNATAPHSAFRASGPTR